MALCGNHGIIVPRDRALLFDLYWTQNKTLPEIGAMFDVTHKSIERVMRDLGIPRRKVGQSRHIDCIECGKPIVKIHHATNGSYYGKRCREHQRAHRLHPDATVTVQLIKDQREGPVMKRPSSTPTLMPMPGTDALDTAIMWLRVNNGDSGESDHCNAVADWLEAQVLERQLRRAAREAGLPVAAIRQRLAAQPETSK